jgi:hypothetical protein
MTAAPPGNVGNLRGREGDHPVVEVMAEEDVEIMEVSARSAEQKDGFHDDLTALKLPCIFPCPMGLRLCRKSLAGVTSTALFGRGSAVKKGQPETAAKRR